MESPELSSASSSASFDSASSPNTLSPSNPWAYPLPYTGLAKVRIDSCRGFDFTDDQEFCPALATPLMTHAKYDTTYIASVASFNPSASRNANFDSGSDAVPTLAVSEKKTLQIIDPSTGMPVARA